MTSLLPPNLLKLFAPRPLPPFLKPLSRDESHRGANRQRGVANLLRQIREDAEEAEIKGGLADQPTTSTSEKVEPEEPVVKEENKGKDVMEVDGEDGEVKEKKKTKAKVVKPMKKDKISEMGVVGQEAIKMRRELRAKRREQYKKDLEKSCAYDLLLGRGILMDPADSPQDDEKAAGDPYKTLFISRLVSHTPRFRPVLS
jgi:U1 small nuclear ribonucleoprotein